MRMKKTDFGIGRTRLVIVAGALSLVAPCRAATATPLEHVVVIFQENVSFDHYFGTYPLAENRKGEPAFYPSSTTPSINGLNANLLAHNPNSSVPMRLDSAHAATCDQDHDYTNEQKAFHGGLMDKFVEFTGDSDDGCDPRMVMSYFDGNTVTALWNYAQNYALSDNFYGTTFGPSTPGALNLAAGQTHGAVPADLTSWGEKLTVAGTVIGDPQPEFDDCSGTVTVRMTGANVGDLLNRKGVTWGWFQGGFRPTERTKDGRAVCGAAHIGSNGRKKHDYIPHHQPFQYYRSTANPRHLAPASSEEIGRPGRANHQYDLEDFWTAAEAGSLPAVSFVKAAAHEDGHAGYSDPIREQAYLVRTINRLQALPEWRSMAILIAYDDSDGWYDHVMPPIVRQSNHPGIDALTGPDSCGATATGGYSGRCGYGPRLPLLVISPFAKVNFVDHSITDLSSILRLIEDNWQLGRIGDQSFDESAGSLLNMFNFERVRADVLPLDPKTGRPLGDPNEKTNDDSDGAAVRGAGVRETAQDRQNGGR